MSVRVSVVIPTYNEEQRLRHALASLSAQDQPLGGAEIVVVDDATPHFSPLGLDQLAHPLNLQLIRHTTNQGRSRTRNDGIAAARGEVIVFLDSDMTVEPGFLQVHAALHQQHTKAVGIGQVRFAAEIRSVPFTRYIESRGVHQLKYNQAIPFKCFATGNASAHRQQLEQIGFFDPQFTAYGGEDLELGYRLHRHGSTFHYLPEALSWHHHIRPLEQIYDLMYTYGRYSMPLLLAKHPELESLLRVNWLRGSVGLVRRLLFRAALWGPAYYPWRFAARLGLPLPDLVFDYLLWFNRTRGFVDAFKAKGDLP